MAENDNGRLNFSVGIDTEELKRGSEEAVRQFDEIASEAQAKGAEIDRAFGTDAARGASSLSSAVRQSLADIGRSCEEHEAAIASLEGEYSRLGKEMSKAYETGRDGDLQEIQERATAIKAEISLRKETLAGLREQADALEQEAAKMEGSRAGTEALGEAHVSLRQRIRELQAQMAELREQGIDETSEAYRELTAELGRLRDIQSDIQKQGSVLSNDQAQFQGIISGIQGVTGGYSALSGVMGLFGAKNEELNRIMAKAQSLMSITIGLQQVSQMLDKDSAFQLTTVAKVREWWNKLLDVGRGKTTANTAAVELNTAAQKGNAGAVRTAGAAQQTENVIAETGTAANITLAGAFRMVGAAIKSIPVFGWIATAITAIVSVVTHFVSKAKEAKKAADEFNKSVAEMAAEPVTAMMKLQAEWNALGDSMGEKQKYIEKNRQEFEKLGLAIKDVNDAEAVFTSDETLNNYIKAQVLRARANKIYEDIREQVENIIEAQDKLEAIPENDTSEAYGEDLYNQVLSNSDLQKQREAQQTIIDEAYDSISKSLGKYIEWENGATSIIEEINKGVKQSADDTAEVIGPMQASISALNSALKRQQEIRDSAVIGTEEFAEAQKRVNEIQAQLDAAMGKTSGTNADKEAKAREDAEKSAGAALTKIVQQNEKDQIALMEDGHEKRMKQIEFDHNEEMAKIEKQVEEFRKYNETTGVATTQAGEGVEEWQVGLTDEQIKAIGDAQEIASGKKVAAIEEENARVKAETDKANAELLKGIETYESRRLEIEREYAERRRALYDEEGNLREGVTQENITNLELREQDAYKKLYETYLNELSSMSLDALYALVDELDTAVVEADDALRLAEAQGASEEELTALRGKLQMQTEKATAAMTKYREVFNKVNNIEDKNNDTNKKNSDSTAELGNAISKMGHEVSEVGDAFSDLGDQIGGAFGEALSDIGETSSKIGSVLSSIGKFVEVGIAGIQSMSWAGVSAIKAVENASTILAMIGMVMEIATAIASLFNNDDKKEEEIEALQERIDDLQWELDNAEAARVRDATGGALSAVSEMYQQALSDAKKANKEGKSYVSLMAEWTQAANKAKASDVAHEKTVEGIIKTYTNLGYTVDKAIGEDKYKAAGDAVKNYAEQLALTYEQYEKEQSKKKTDTDKLKEYEQTMDEIAESMVDTLNSAVEDIIGGSYEDIAKQLGDAFVEAFQAGEDAAEAWGDTVEDIVNDIVRQMLIQQWIEPKIAEIFDRYMARWFNGEGEYQGNQAVVDSMQDFSDELNGAMGDFAEAWAEISEAMGWMSDSTREAATQGIASASQESIDELNGRMTAIQGHTYSINDNVAILVTTNGLILQSVLNIESNTDRLVSALEEAGDTADGILTALDDIQLKGVRVK